MDDTQTRTHATQNKGQSPLLSLFSSPESLLPTRRLFGSRSWWRLGRIWHVAASPRVSLLVHEARKNGLCAPPPTAAGQSEQLQTFRAKSQEKPSGLPNLPLSDSLPAAGRGTVEQNLRGKRAQGAGGGGEVGGETPDWCDGRAQ